MALEVTNKDSGVNRLELLKKLQSIDDKSHDFSRQKKAIESRIDAKEARIADATARLADKHEELLDFQKNIDRKHLDLKCVEEGILKSRERLLQIKSNREYSAHLSEIGGKEADKGLLEDEILSMMTEFENITAAEQELKAEAEREKKELVEIKAEVENELSLLGKNIAETRSEWEEAARQVDKSALLQYKRLLGKDGQAVVEVVAQTCGGCCMQITAQTLNLLLRREDIILCQNCEKILYIANE